MGVSLDLVCFFRAIATVLFLASLLRNLEDRPSLKTRLSIEVPKRKCDIRLLYKTFPIKWKSSRFCSLWLASLRSAIELFELFFWPFLAGFLSTREDNCSSMTAPLISPREHVIIISSIFFAGRSDKSSWKCWSTIACRAFIINVGATGLKLHKFSHAALWPVVGSLT